MIKYPLNVTIDTNVFEAKRFSFSTDKTIKLLVKNINDGKINLVLSNVVIKEIENHIVDNVSRVCSKMKKTRKEVISILPEQYLNDIGLGSYLETPNQEVFCQKAKEVFSNFLLECKAERLGTNDVDFEKVLDDYFCFRPPFEKSEKKRKEFPDAIVAEEINKRFGKDEIVAIVSNDKGFKSACFNTGNQWFFSSLEELFDYMNKSEDEYNDACELVNKNIERIKLKLNHMIDDSCVIVCGQTIDSNGIIEGYDYDETHIEEFCLTDVRLFTINDIDNSEVFVSVWVDCHMTIECTIDDYDNSYWDSEAKEYVFLEQRRFSENHNAKFACRLTIDKTTEEISILPFKMVLGGDTLINRAQD